MQWSCSNTCPMSTSFEFEPAAHLPPSNLHRRIDRAIPFAPVQAGWMCISLGNVRDAEELDSDTKRSIGGVRKVEVERG